MNVKRMPTSKPNVSVTSPWISRHRVDALLPGDSHRTSLSTRLNLAHFGEPVRSQMSFSKSQLVLLSLAECLRIPSYEWLKDQACARRPGIPTPAADGGLPRSGRGMIEAECELDCTSVLREHREHHVIRCKCGSHTEQHKVSQAYAACG